jgi:hypothetical protein
MTTAQIPASGCHLVTVVCDIHPDIGVLSLLTVSFYFENVKQEKKCNTSKDMGLK